MNSYLDDLNNLLQEDNDIVRFYDLILKLSSQLNQKPHKDGYYFSLSIKWDEDFKRGVINIHARKFRTGVFMNVAFRLREFNFDSIEKISQAILNSNDLMAERLFELLGVGYE